MQLVDEDEVVAASRSRESQPRSQESDEQREEERDAQAVPFVDLDAAKDGAVGLCPLLGDSGAPGEAGDDAGVGGGAVHGWVDRLCLLFPLVGDVHDVLLSPVCVR